MSQKLLAWSENITGTGVLSRMNKYRFQDKKISPYGTGCQKEHQYSQDATPHMIGAAPF